MMSAVTIRHIYAHHWADLGDDRIPRWPSKTREKRPLKVTINSYTTIGALGAKHWYVSAEEEDNQWWCESKNAWIELSCDSGRIGCTMRGSVLSREDAIKLALTFVEIVAGPKRSKHVVSWDGPGRPRWARSA